MLNHYWRLKCHYVFEGVIAKDILYCLNLIIVEEGRVAVKIFKNTVLERKSPNKACGILAIKVDDVWAGEILKSHRDTISHLFISVIDWDSLIVVRKKVAVVKGEYQGINVVLCWNIPIVEEKDLAGRVKFEQGIFNQYWLL